MDFIPAFKPLAAAPELVEISQKAKAQQKRNAKIEDEALGQIFVTKYNERVGLFGRWYAILRPRNSFRVIWDGSVLLNFETRRVIDQDFGLQKGVCFDGFMYTKNGQTYYEIFDNSGPNATYEQRRSRLNNYSKRFSKNVSLCEFQVYGCIFREFQLVASLLDTTLKNDSNKHPALYLIEAKSMLRNLREDPSYREFIMGWKRHATIVQLIEGSFQLRGKLGKFKCEDPKSHYTFYCGKQIPLQIRNSYVFQNTKLLRITNANVPDIGDTIQYSCVELIHNDLPREAFYEGFIKKNEQDSGV
jgi:hypothetical protein